MKITIIAVGKALPKNLKEVASQYEKRLRQQVAISWQFIPPSGQKDSTLAKNEESNSILKTIKPGSSIILLDERGKQLNNQQFVETFEKYAGLQGNMVFIIGGAFGVTDEVINRADIVWSFSKLVFPHQLMRLMLLEQLYRTLMLKQGHPYHHS